MKPLAPTTAPDPVRDARQLYRFHREAAQREAKMKNLDLLWDVLEAMRSDGCRDYCLAEIGRRLEAVGGPKTQSLRNAQGGHFREVIGAYAAGIRGSTRYAAKSKSQVEVALDLITDPSIRATLRMAIEEGKRLKVVNDNLHAAFKTLQIGVLADPVATAKPPAPVSSMDAGPKLSWRLLRALRKGIDHARLAERGLVVMDDGSIEDEHGNVLFPPSFVTAIEAATLRLEDAT